MLRTRLRAAILVTACGLAAIVAYGAWSAALSWKLNGRPASMVG